MKFKFFVSKEEYKNNKKSTGLRYNENLHRLESKDIIIDLVSGHASIGGLTVARKLNKQYVLTNHIYVFHKELKKVKKALLALGKKPDIEIRASYGLDRIPDMLAEISYQKETAKDARRKDSLKKDASQLKKILNKINKQNQEDLTKLGFISGMLTRAKRRSSFNEADQPIESTSTKFNLFSPYKIEIGKETDNFIYRVRLSQNQSIVAFNQNDKIKIKFEKEDFAPGLSSFIGEESPEKIFNSIKENKSEPLSDLICIEAIKTIFDFIFKKPGLFKKKENKIVRVGESQGRLIKEKSYF